MSIFKIAKPGGNVNTDEEKDLSFTSDRVCMIEFMSGNTTVATDDDGNGTREITHNLGYIPDFHIFEKGYFDSTYWYPKYVFIAYADSTKLYIVAEALDANTTYDIFYSISANKIDNEAGSGNSNALGKVRIAKNGYDASTSTDIRNFNFVSSYNIPKVDDDISSSITQEIGADYPIPTTITIPHNLGYVPVCYVLWEDNAGMLPYTLPLIDSDYALYYIDSTNLYIEARYSEGAVGDATFKYKILRDKIS